MGYRDCPHEEGVLLAGEDDAALRHLEGCRSCRELKLVAAWVRERSPDPAPAPRGAAHGQALWRLARAGAAAHRRAGYEVRVLTLWRWATVASLAVGACWIGRGEVASLAGGVVASIALLDSAAARLAAEAGQYAALLVIALLAATGGLARRALAR